MASIGGSNDIQHVFVLMLENRSFDHMFALSGIPGITAATAADSNRQGAVDYHFGPGAPPQMPSDPLHEFAAVMTQLCGAATPAPPATPYPPRTNSGFVANYATTKLPGKQPLPAGDFGKIMLGVDTPSQAPSLYTLARNYALCDQWYSSLPGPTWPNRFFMHGASSDGMADSPGAADILKWEVLKGFRYPHGSIYQRLKSGNYRLYQDKSGPLSGQIPQVASLKGIDYFDVHGLDAFEKDLKDGHAARYTFIEPAYGDIVSDSYRHGSSQHPMDGLAGGDRLIARVYNAIRDSALWARSLLIVTYDEHGGFYDSGKPAKAAPPPGDGTGAQQNKFGFDFSVYGVRVPAVIVSPWIAKGVVDHTLYDHASALATVERLFGLAPLTDRDRKASDLRGLLTGVLRNDADCPRLPVPPLPAAPKAMAMAAAPPPKSDAEPIEDGSNLQAFLYVVRKAHRDVRGDTKAMVAFQPVQTRGAARAYLDAVLPQLEAERLAGK